MTVNELIGELQRFPGHHRVFIEFPDRSNPEAICPESEVASVAELRGEGDCCVVIDGTCGVL